MRDTDDPRRPAGGSARRPAPSAPQVVESTALFGAANELVIRHNGRDYCLRLTRLGKLILTA
jgi:hemin uptake protein HemP